MKLMTKELEKVSHLSAVLMGRVEMRSFMPNSLTLQGLGPGMRQSTTQKKKYFLGWFMVGMKNSATSG